MSADHIYRSIGESIQATRDAIFAKVCAEAGGRLFAAASKASPMTELEKWRRMTNPQCLADYGISVDMGKLAEEASDVFRSEVEPWLTKRHA